MGERTRRAPLIAAAVLAAVPAVDGSFLVRGLVQPRQPRPTPPAGSSVTPSAAAQSPRVRCPMTIVDANPKIDPRLVKRPPAGARFTMRVTPADCPAK